VAEEIDHIPPNAFFDIDDPRVSRNHAQLRAIEGNYVLFDVSSTGGTFVNGSRVSETIIYPNDTISLGGVTLIFHQDDPPPRTDLIDTYDKS
jgi:pSer/pThr/pTyr-binding forkhead associated (FHA) protein